jgi:hypothetical protein
MKLNKTVGAAPAGFCDEEDQELFKIHPGTFDEKHLAQLEKMIEWDNYW